MLIGLFPAVKLAVMLAELPVIMLLAEISILSLISILPDTDVLIS